MRHVTITGPVEKRCPYRDEPDVGTITLLFKVEGDAPELHALAEQLTTWGDIALSHEDFTAMVRNYWSEKGCVTATTTWQTAGLTVEVTA